MVHRVSDPNLLKIVANVFACASLNMFSEGTRTVPKWECFPPFVYKILLCRSFYQYIVANMCYKISAVTYQLLYEEQYSTTKQIF